MKLINYIYILALAAALFVGFRIVEKKLSRAAASCQKHQFSSKGSSSDDNASIEREDDKDDKDDREESEKRLGASSLLTYLFRVHYSSVLSLDVCSADKFYTSKTSYLYKTEFLQLLSVFRI